MDNLSNEQNEPVCRFGPGGDFVSFWPKQNSTSRNAVPNSLALLLERLAKIINTRLTPDFDASADSAKKTHQPQTLSLPEKGKLKYEVKHAKSEKPTDAETTAVIKSNCDLQDQQMLFPDDRRVSIPTGHKPKHRIRAYRRTPKKKAPVQLPGQGSLFEADFRCAKTA
jgi:hypothetical protein